MERRSFFQALFAVPVVAAIPIVNPAPEIADKPVATRPAQRPRTDLHDDLRIPIGCEEEFSEWQAINGISIQSAASFLAFMPMFRKTQKLTERGFGLKVPTNEATT